VTPELPEGRIPALLPTLVRCGADANPLPRNYLFCNAK